MGTVTVDGVELFYRENGAGPPILLIHGGGPDSRGWGPISEELARDHRVIAYDRRGYGQSAAEPAPDWHRHGEDAAAVLEGLRIAPCPVVGWSSGGTVAIDLAAHHPDLVSSLVVLEPALHGRKHIGAALARTFLSVQALRMLGRERRAAETWFRYLCGYRDGDGNSWDHPDFPQERREWMLGNARTMFRGDFRARDGYLSADRLSAIDCPVTVILGERTIPWLTRTARAAAETLPTAKLHTIPGANHAFAIERPRETAAAIRAVVSSERRQASAAT